MNYKLLQQILALSQEFEENNTATGSYPADIDGFKRWVADQNIPKRSDPDWEGKENGRSPESIINTSIVHLNRYAKNYSKSAIYGSEFSTQEDFVYLIVLRACGEMTKMELIKRNVQDKPTGMQIINRLIAQGWVEQKISTKDKRSRIINITEKGTKVLETQMDKIRQATSIVTGDLNREEKMELIRLLNKLKDFHHPIYLQQLEPASLLEEALRKKSGDMLN